MDSADLAKATQELNNGKAMTREEFLRYTDSTNSNLSVTFNGQQYSNRQQYDSFINAGLIKPGWFEKKIVTVGLKKKLPTNSLKLAANIKMMVTL